MHLAGQVALVTGSSRGIGHAIGRALVAAGADLAVHGRQGAGASAEGAAGLVEHATAAGRRAAAFQADVAVRTEVEAMMAKVGETFGRLDVLVLNAAKAPFKPTERLLERDLRQLVDVNFLGNVFCAQKALPLLSKQGGSIVFVSSLGSRFMNPEYPLGAMKAAMETMVRQWAEEWAGRGIRVNAVCAGLVKTDAFLTLRQIWPETAAMPDDLFVTPEEVADVVTFLTSPAARAIRGQTLVVDRGLSNRVLRAP
ncbi:MAG: SDR family oxidoreductase [Planctomycetes bacterium]|nr:SDR family oxidoreductase [Planctomycetota bacterium]